MSFVRPDVVAALQRWREAIAGGVIAGIGCWWILGTGGLLFWLGLVLIPTGLSLAGLGIQRGRLRTGSVGPGIVQVDEGRVIYYGPLTGGVVDLETLSRLDIDPSGRPVHWVLHQPGQEPVFVPVNATGAEPMLDAFAMLPGFPTGRAIAALTHPDTKAVTIWRRAPSSVAALGANTPPTQHRRDTDI